VFKVLSTFTSSVESPQQNSSHVLENDPKLLLRMCKAKDCCSQSNKMNMYSNSPFLFTPTMDTWGRSIRNITNRMFLFSTSFGTVPEDWRKANVTPVFRMDKQEDPGGSWPASPPSPER